MTRDRRDRSQNWYMKNHGGALLRLLPITGVKRWQAVHNVLGYPKQMPDGFLDVTFENRTSPDPFLIEIESYPDRETAEQVLRDVAMVILERRVVPDVLVFVLQPKGNLRIDPNQIAQSAHGLAELRWKVHVVNLWTIPADDLLEAGDVGLIPWVPLARHAGSPRALLAKCRDRIEEQARPEEQDNLLAVTRTMADARYNDLELLSLLGGNTMSFTTVLLNTPAGKRFLAQKAKETAKRAELANTRKHILKLLTKRFDSASADTAKQLRAVKEQAKLDHLLECAALCPNLDAFQAALDQA